MFSKEINDYKLNGELNIDKIIDDYTPYIKTIINNMANSLSSEDKEEILSDTFFILWKNENEEIIFLDSYIAGIARNLIREKLRKRKIFYNISDYEDVIGCYDIDLHYNEREEIEKMKNTFSLLKSIDLEILNMFYFYSMSIKEIAKKLNLSEINVKSKLHRIRKKIRKFLS